MSHKKATKALLWVFLTSFITKYNNYCFINYIFPRVLIAKIMMHLHISIR